MVDVERRNPRYIAILGIVACLVLIGGWLLRPRDIPSSPPPVPSETDLAQLARRAQRRALDDMTKYFADVAAAAAPSLAHLPGDDVTATVWDASHVVTPPRPDRSTQPVIVRFGSGEREGRSDVAGPNVPLATVAVDSPQASVVRRATAPPASGDWVVAVWRSAGAPTFAAASFHQVIPRMCGVAPIRELQSSLSLTRAMVGGALFNLDGALVGVILPCDNRLAVVDTGSIDEIIKLAETVEQRIIARYGILFSMPSDTERQYFTGARGPFVREVWIGGAGDAAGIHAGDLVVALDDQPVTTVDDMRPLVESSEGPFDLRVLRGARTVSVTVGSRPRGDVAVTGVGEELGLNLDPPSDTYRIDVVRSDSRAARAGIRPGDRLARINGTEPPSLRQVRRAMSSSGRAAMLLEIVREKRRIAVVVPEAPS